MVDPHSESATGKSEIKYNVFFGQSSPGVNDSRNGKTVNDLLGLILAWSQQPEKYVT